MTRDPKHLEAQVKAVKGSDKGLPPLDQWHPKLSGDIDIRILRDGTWLYNGEPLKREAIARLFATILRREDDGQYYLVTPVEKWRIQVEDAPLLAHTLEVEGGGEHQQVFLTTNMGERLALGAEHPLSVDRYPERDEPRPIIAVRHGVDARLVTSAFYDLANYVAERQINGVTELGFWSQGAFWPVG